MNVPLPPVLVVDDEKNMRLSLKTVLADERYGVRTVESAEEALELLARDQCGVDAIDRALDRLMLAVPIIKKNLIEACARVVGADGVIQEAEAELLRAIADTLDCPIPPLGVDA